MTVRKGVVLRREGQALRVVEVLVAVLDPGTHLVTIDRDGSLPHERSAQSPPVLIAVQVER